MNFFTSTCSQERGTVLKNVVNESKNTGGGLYLPIWSGMNHSHDGNAR